MRSHNFPIFFEHPQHEPSRATRFVRLFRKWLRLAPVGVGSWCTRGRLVNGRAFKCRWHLLNIFYQIWFFIPTFVVVVVVGGVVVVVVVGGVGVGVVGGVGVGVVGGVGVVLVVVLVVGVGVVLVVLVVLVLLAVCNTGDIENLFIPIFDLEDAQLSTLSRALSWHSSFVSQGNHQLHHSNSPQVWLHAFFYAVDSTGVGDLKMNDVSFRATAFMDRCQVIDRLGINTPHLQQIDSYRHTANFLSCM